jgi:hypothetical protein
MGEALNYLSAAPATAGRERRRGGRIACRLIRTQFGDVVDLSATGVRIASKRVPRLYEGEHVLLKIQGFSESLTVNGKAVRCVAAAAGYHTAFEFLDLTPEQRQAIHLFARTGARGELAGDHAANRLGR